VTSSFKDTSSDVIKTFFKTKNHTLISRPKTLKFFQDQLSSLVFKTKT